MTKPKALFNRKETTGLAKRFVKAESYDAARDLMVMYKLFKQFPSEKFWRNYDLGFQLNAALWFLGQDGQDKLKQDWSLFNLDLPKQEVHTLSTEKQGNDFVAPIQKPKTIADLLK